jgi:endonuclease V-like protein UPF0215 family
MTAPVKPGQSYKELAIPVIGVAMTRFASAVHVVPVLRGSATQPLYATWAGIPSPDAAKLVRRMTGKFRRPDPLRVDNVALSRSKR